MGGLGDAGIFFFVIIFDLFLWVEEPSGIGLELTAGELGLHDKGVGGDVDLAAKVHEFMHGGLGDDIFDGGLELGDFSLFFHQLLL